MGEPGTVRGAEAGDAAAIAALHVRAWQAAYRGLLPQHHLDTLDVEARRLRWHNHLTDPGHRGSVLVAELPDGSLAGFVSCGASRDDDAAPDCGELASLYVEPGLIGQGHGRRLVDAALDSLSRNGFREVTVWALSTNQQGRGFYERTGWTDTGVEKDDEVAGTRIVDVRYHRTLDRASVLVTSRSFEEYQAFFDLDLDDLAGTVLDCSAGASGFAAVANREGGHVTAVDPAYARADDDVLAEAVAAVAGGGAIIDRHSDAFVWDWYGSPEARAAMRRQARDAFAEDYRRHRDRYVAAALPHLPFPDATFDLALCSHLLFTWSDRFDEDWHLAALLELSRVATEVRVFPLVVQGSGAAVPFLSWLVQRLDGEGLACQVVTVSYEFQRGANQMLVVRRRSGHRTSGHDRHNFVRTGSESA